MKAVVAIALAILFLVAFAGTQFIPRPSIGGSERDTFTLESKVFGWPISFVREYRVIDFVANARFTRMSPWNVSAMVFNSICCLLVGFALLQIGRSTNGFSRFTLLHLVVVTTFFAAGIVCVQPIQSQLDFAAIVLGVEWQPSSSPVHVLVSFIAFVVLGVALTFGIVRMFHFTNQITTGCTTSGEVEVDGVV
ncbi:MAG: hypothetical protein AAF802_28970 [Planctomycetota bacterium]